MIGITTQKTECIINSDSNEKNLPLKEKVRRVINNIFYIQDVGKYLRLKVSKGKNPEEYRYEIVENNHFSLSELEKLTNNYSSLGILGETELKKDSNKQEAFTFYKEIYSQLDLFGIKRLMRFFLNNKK